MPTWCSVTTNIESPQPASLERVAKKILGKQAESFDRAALCDSLRIALDSPDCPERGPWFALDTSDRVALVVPSGPDQFAAISELAMSSAGSEESWDVEFMHVSATPPLGGSLLVSESVQECDDEDEEEPLCGMIEQTRRHVLVRGLEAAKFLVVDIEIDVEAAGAALRTPLEPARMLIEGNVVELWACGGRTRFDVTGASLDEAERVDPPASPSQTTSPEAAVEAGKRCGQGWAAFGTGDLASAKLDVDAALAILEHASDPKGRRSLGACLYNRGRIAEAEGQTAEARELYERSIAARPNATVEARLASLP